MEVPYNKSEEYGDSVVYKVYGVPEDLKKLVWPLYQSEADWSVQYIGPCLTEMIGEKRVRRGNKRARPTV